MNGSTDGFRTPRRVITGYDDTGASVILADAPVGVEQELPDDGVAFHEVWRTASAPATIGAGPADDPTTGALTVAPTETGTSIRVIDFLPGHLDAQGLQSPVHRTESIDYGIVLEGELTLIVDDAETTLRAGDIVVQRGVDHAWANRSDRVARVVFVLVGGRFDDALLALRPDLREGLMRHGPRDAGGDAGGRAS